MRITPLYSLLLVLLAEPCPLPGAAAEAVGAGLRLDSPTDFQVFQRRSAGEGSITVAGTLATTGQGGATLEVRLAGPGLPETWREVATTEAGQREFSGQLVVPAGGWYRVEVRARAGEAVVAESGVAHVGVGEVFVVAGQSNSANHGEERQSTRTERVAAFDGTAWRLANDPQPGASGDGGSFLPPFGDALVERFRVPIGLVATGVGATSVREWLPRGARFPNPPTLTGNVTELPGGEWESKGGLFAGFTARLRSLGKQGFRAVLWHQGESDANQRDASRTLPGDLYRQLLEKLVAESRREVGWEFPWFVAQASYHTPDDPGSPEIRAAQKGVWESGLALEGPDTDALAGALRENKGQGVHFSDPGLRAHAAAWVEKVAPWLDAQLIPIKVQHRLRPPLRLHRSHR